MSPGTWRLTLRATDRSPQVTTRSGSGRVRPAQERVLSSVVHPICIPVTFAPITPNWGLLVTVAANEPNVTGVDAEVREWVSANWSLDITLREWWHRLSSSGLAFPTWPVDWHGRGWERAAVATCSRLFSEVGAIGAPTGLGTLMGGPVVLQHGTDEQKSRLLPSLANGTEGWCQLFSEPGAGSDLASVATRAERDGDEWIISGQKVWTSGATDSARGMLVARTDLDQPKHRGITYFIIDMRQPGIEIRPIKQMNGRSHFSEVFFDEARVHDRDRISSVNNGWAVAVATLAFERSGLSAPDGVSGVRPSAGELAGQLDRAVGEIVDEARRRKATPDDAGGGYTMLLRVARELGRTSDPTVRQLFAKAYSRDRIAGFTQQRSAAAAKAGRVLGPEASLAKLFWTEGLHASRDLGTAVLGPHGMLSGPETPGSGVVQFFALTIPSARIAGGSDEVQRNIIGERVLGLPKDIVVDADVPFRSVRRS